MQIQSNNFKTNFTSNNKSFGATQIDSVKLLKKVDSDKFIPIKATFSELDINNPKDIALIKNLKESWKNLTSFGQCVFDDFLNKINISRYFITEAYDGNEKKVTNIVETVTSKNPFKKSCEIMYLQSSPEIANKQSASPIKGSGEIAMYEIVKMSKNDKIPSVSLLSVADDFYKKIGLKDMSKDEYVSIFGLKKNDYKKFMKRIEKKYDIN